MTENDVGQIDGGEAMESEFDVVAVWTADAVAELGSDHALPAACRGSGSPAALDWLGEAMGLRPGERLVDSGAGMGGPAAYAADRFGVRPVLTEPMIGACGAARRLFAHPVVAGGGEGLPFATGSVPAAWSLGVLCTTVDEGALLSELHRVLEPGGSLGLLVFVRVVDSLPEQPEDNDFPTPTGLEGALGRTGFRILGRTDVGDLASTPPGWEERVGRVEEVVARHHRDDPHWIEARRNEEIIGRLLAAGHVVGRLVHARRA